MNAREAKAFLCRRYAEQAERWPLLPTKVSEGLYVRRNLRAAMRMTPSRGGGRVQTD